MSCLSPLFRLCPRCLGVFLSLWCVLFVSLCVFAPLLASPSSFVWSDAAPRGAAVRARGLWLQGPLCVLSPLSASCLCFPCALLRGAVCAPPFAGSPLGAPLLCPLEDGRSPPAPAQVPHFLPPGGPPGQEPAFPTFLPSELSACLPHLHPSPSWGKPP